MKSRCLLLVLICSQFDIFQAQTQIKYEVEKLPSRIRLSGDLLQMNYEPNIGFIGHSYEVFGLLNNQPDIYFGVNSYSALTGIRSGFFVFGISGGIQKTFFKNWLNYDVGLFIGGGGGSGTPDGGGLMIRPHMDLQFDINDKISLRSGLAAVKFPTGDINSFNVNIGAVIKVNTYLADEINSNQAGEKVTTFNHIDLSILSMNLFNYSKGPLKDNVATKKVNVSTISLLGAMFRTRHKNNFYGVLKLGGAFIGQVDGFAMLLSGLGYELPINDWFVLDAKTLIGGAGGGNVQFGGGLATQLEVGLGLKISDYIFSLGYGKTYAPTSNGNFQSNHLDISLGKKFHLFTNKEINKSLIVVGSVKKENFSFSTFNRTYFSQDKLDKNGLPYDSAFNLIGFELGKKSNDHFSIILSTVWAYQGSYGAFAEGWIGLKYDYFMSDQWRITTKTSIGAAGGGGINLGNGLAYQYSLGIEKKINKRWSFVANVGQVRPVLDGNFTPILLDIGMKLNISQLVRKY